MKLRKVISCLFVFTHFLERNNENERISFSRDFIVKCFELVGAREGGSISCKSFQ